MTKQAVAALFLAAAVGIVAAIASDEGAPSASPATQPVSTQPARFERSFYGVGAFPRPTRQAASQPLSQDEEKAVLEFLKENRPGRHERLLALRQTDPEGYQLALGAMHTFMRRWTHMPKPMRELAIQAKDAEIQALQLVRQMRTETDAQALAALRKQLAQAVGELVDAELKLRELRLEQLEMQLERLREELAERRKQRGQLIEQRMEAWMLAPGIPEPRSEEAP